MERNLKGFAAAGSLFLAMFAAEAGFAQKQGGILTMAPSQREFRGHPASRRELSLRPTLNFMRLVVSRRSHRPRHRLGEHDPGLRAVGHKYDSLSSPHLETMIVSVAGAPCQKTSLVGMAIANETGQLRNRWRR